MAELQYIKEHQWILIQGKEALIGISEYASSELGDLVFVDLPKVGQPLGAGDLLCNLEAVKAESETYSPASGTIVEVNQALEKRPELINESPLEQGWIVRIELDQPLKTLELMSQSEYQQYTKGLSK